MPFSFEVAVQEELRAAFAANGVEVEDVALRKVPFASGWGLATHLALTLGRGKQGAQEVAQAVANHLEAQGLFKRVEAANGYVNVYIEAASAAGSVLTEILAAGDRYGAGSTKAEQVMVEYSQPNTHKEFHIGHLRNAAIGNAIVRLLRFAGSAVLSANYIGDMGAHVIRCMWCLRKYHAGEKPPADRLAWLGAIYTEAVRRIEQKEPGADVEIAELFKRWEAEDPELLALWRETKAWCMDELQRIYRQLDVSFDVWYFESEVEAEGKRMAQELLDRGVAEISEGLPIVRLDDKLGVIPILRSDGTSLYQTKELALSVRKFREYDIAQAIVVTDVSQSLYFKQVFKVLELYGFDRASALAHIGYERVNLPEGKMASRAGNVVSYEDLAREAIRRVRAIIHEKNPALVGAEAERVAEDVGVGALKFAMLSVANSSVITFEWDRVLDFDGYAGPYIQYAFVRASRILSKSDEAAGVHTGSFRVEASEQALLELLVEFPQQVARAAKQCSPVTIAQYTHALAKQFSEFYQACPVLKEADAGQRAFRLSLVACTKQVLANGLSLLGMALPESM